MWCLMFVPVINFMGLRFQELRIPEVQRLLLGLVVLSNFVILNGRGMYMGFIDLGSLRLCIMGAGITGIK